MPNTPVEIKKTLPAATEAWHGLWGSFRNEIDIEVKAA